MEMVKYVLILQIQENNFKKYGRNAKVFGGEKQFQSSGTGDDSPLVDTGALRQAITIDKKPK